MNIMDISTLVFKQFHGVPKKQTWLTRNGDEIRLRTYRASSLAALGLQNLPLLSILGNISLESLLGFSRASSTVNVEVRREVRGELLADNGFGIKPTRWDFPNSKEEDEEWVRVKLREE
jgi:hypothetical protein